MKTKEFLALAGMLYLASCQPSDTNRVQMETKRYPIQFSLQLKEEVLPFPATRSMPTLTVPDPIGEKNTPTPPSEEELYNRIEYIVYKAEEPATLVHHRTYKSSDDDFPTIYDSLPAGNYKIAFLAHSSNAAELSGNRLSFDKVSDTFQTCETVTVSANTDLVKDDITLQRIVSRIEFVSTEAAPSNLKQFDMEIEPYYNQTDVFTGAGLAQSSPFLITYPFTTKEETIPTHSFYTFIPSESATISAKLSTTFTDDSKSEVREINDIAPIANKIIRYKGKLYSPKNPEETFQIQISGDGKWDESGEDIPLD